MDAVRGLAADTVWRPALTASARATVGSSFDRAVNLEIDGRLLTLVTASGRPAPGALVTDAERFPRLPVGTSVEIGAGWVCCGSIRVDATECRYFSCRAMTVGSRALEPDPDRWRDALLDQSVTGSFVSTPLPSAFDRALHRRLVAAAANLQHELGGALSGVGEPRLTAASEGLVGLGVGLTPSGDDYLVGSLAALHHVGAPARVVSALGAAVLAALARISATTTVSKHFLEAAAEGRFQHDILRAAEAALTAPDDVVAAFGAVAQIGSTSGTDVLHGLVDTLATCLAPTHLVLST